MLVLIEGRNFFVVDLQKNIVAVLSAKVFKLTEGVKIEQSFIDVEQVSRNVVGKCILLIVYHG